MFDAVHNGSPQLWFSNYTCFEEKLSLILPKVQIGTGKKCRRKSKQQCRSETQNKTWWYPESEKAKDRFRSNYQSTLDGLIKETLLADNNQDLSSTVKADAFCRTLKQKKETLAVLTTAQEKLEGEYKDLLLTWLMKCKTYSGNIFNFFYCVNQYIFIFLDNLHEKDNNLCAVIFEFPVFHIYFSLFFLSKNLPWNIF